MWRYYNVSSLDEALKQMEEALKQSQEAMARMMKCIESNKAQKIDGGDGKAAGGQVSDRTSVFPLADGISIEARLVEKEDGSGNNFTVKWEVDKGLQHPDHSGINLRIFNDDAQGQ